MIKYFNLYENIDKINPVELKKAAGVKDPDKVIWPKGKKYKVQLAGQECLVTTSFSNAEGKVDGDYDAFSAISTMLSRDEVVDKIWKEDPNGHTDAVYYAHAEFLPGLPELDDEEKKHRKAFTAAILMLLSDQKTIEAIAECAPRKKNGLFHKGRIFKIGLTGFAEKYDSQLVEIVGRSKDETNLLLKIEERTTSPEEIEEWSHDFISTYHEGLLISEALKKVFENIQEDPRPKKAQIIQPDLFEGLGDGTQEIDMSELNLNEDYSLGVRPKYMKDVQELLDKISVYLVDPNEIDWEGKGIYINRQSDEVFRNKLREVGAIPLRSFTKRTNYSVRNIDFRKYIKRSGSLNNEEYYISDLSYALDEAKSFDGLIEERDFLRWCLNGHKIKYDLNKDEHLREYDNKKISFNKIDTAKFIKQAIKKTRPFSMPEYKEVNDGEIYYCVVGSGEKAEAVRNFFRSFGKAVMDNYVEGARWPRLILEDINKEEEKRAYKLAQYNKSCGESVQVWSAGQVLDLIDLYGDGIKEHAEKYYDNAILEQLVIEIMSSPNTTKAKDVEKVEERVEIIKEKDAETVMKAIKRIDSIDCKGKSFVFDGNNCSENGVIYGSNDLDNPNVRKVLKRFGVVRSKLSGKTDYFVVNVRDPFIWEGARIRDAATQLSKRDTLTVITLDNLMELLD